MELCLTDYAQFRSPIFKPGFLWDKWPTVDFYVELLGVRQSRPFFLAQAKSTSVPLRRGARSLAVRVSPRDAERLKRLPCPTYVFGIHEPTRRVFVRAVHAGSAQGFSRIPLANELTPTNLRTLHLEVQSFWRNLVGKPAHSRF